MHKTKYGRSLPEQYGYDRKGHEEAYQRLKQNPDALVKDFFRQ